jgi:hypothetical protein
MKRIGIALLAGLFAYAASAAVAAEPVKFDIGGKYVLTAPANWVSKQPKSNIIEYEFEVPVAEGDEIPGRVTVMGAAGGVDANVKRWEGQFKSDAGDVKADIKQIEAAGQPVHIVELKGTYLDKAGPFVQAPAVERPNYRMLGGIIQTKDAGEYFVKFYGPEKTIAANTEAFKKMLAELQAK